MTPSDRDSGLAPRTPAQSAVRVLAPEQRPATAIVPLQQHSAAAFAMSENQQQSAVVEAAAASLDEQPAAGLATQRSNTPSSKAKSGGYGRAEFAVGPFASG
jgi:hypothetical protein